ncbi:MAG: MFS transporter [Oscillospiraceae bacterium]
MFVQHASAKQVTRRFTLLEASFYPAFFLFEGMYAEIMHGFGYGDAFIGVALTAIGVSCFIMQPIMGYIADKTLNYRAIFIVTLGVAAVLFPLFFKFHSSKAIVLSFSVVALGSIKTLFSLMDSWITKMQKQGMAIDYGHLRSVGSIAYAFAAAGLSQVMMLFGMASAVPLYWALFLFMTFAIIRIPNPERMNDEKVSLRFAAGVIFHNKNYLALIICGFLVALSNSSMLSFYARFISELGGSVGVIGIGYFLMAFFEFFIVKNFTKIADKVGTDRILAIGMIGMGVKALAFSLCTSVTMALIITPIMQMISYALLIPGIVRYISEQIPREFLASALIMYEASCLSLAQIIGSTFFGAVAEASSVRTMFAIFSIPALIGGVGFALYWHISKKREMLVAGSTEQGSAIDIKAAEIPHSTD